MHGLLTFLGEYLNADIHRIPLRQRRPHSRKDTISNCPIPGFTKTPSAPPRYSRSISILLPCTIPIIPLIVMILWGGDDPGNQELWFYVRNARISCGCCSVLGQLDYSDQRRYVLLYIDKQQFNGQPADTATAAASNTLNARDSECGEGDEHRKPTLGHTIPDVNCNSPPTRPTDTGNAISSLHHHRHVQWRVQG